MPSEQPASIPHTRASTDGGRFLLRGIATAGLLNRGAWAVADQALFAISNFILNIVLARWLTPVDYGAFSTAYAVFLLVGTLHGALIVEPMLVFGSGRYKTRKSCYLEVLLSGHWLFTACAGGLLVTVGAALLYMRPSSLASALIAVGLCCPLILLQWLTRRICYMNMEPRTAAFAGLLYVLVLVLGAYLLFERGWLNTVSAMGLMGVGSTVSSAYLMSRLRIRWLLSGGASLRREVLAEHWGYGRWSVGASVLGWIPGNIYYVLLPAVVGLAATGALKAIMNLIMPVLHTYLALSILLIPLLVRLRDNTVALWQTVRLALVAFTCAALAYWLVLGGFSREIVHWVYKGQYDADASLLWIIGLVPVAGAGVAVMGSVLRALERPQDIFAAYLISTVVALSAGIGLLLVGGIWGSLVGMVLSSLSTCGAMVWFVWFPPETMTAWRRWTGRVDFQTSENA